METDLQNALGIAKKFENLIRDATTMLQTVANLVNERAKAQLEKERAEEDRDAARLELVRLEQVLKDKQSEVDQAVDRQSAKVAEEEKRVYAPLQKVKDELRTFRAKAMNEKEQTRRQINDLGATQVQLEATLKKLEGNIRARQDEGKALELEMTRTRDAFTQERRNMESERRSLGDTDQIKEELRLARIKANQEKEEIAREVREMKVAKIQVEKDLKTANDNLADRKREEAKAAKAAAETRDRYSQEKHEIEADLENLKNQKINLQRETARLTKGADRTARV